MPTCLSTILSKSTPSENLNPKSLGWKNLSLILGFILSPILFFGQTSLTGLWTGAFSNDSNTIRKEQSFEIALTEYKGKVYGYTRSEFIVNDTIYYIVKRVKGVINGDMCEVKDDEIIAFNFPTRLDKGVKVTSTFYRNKVDSTWHLAGNWKTNKTKTFYSVTGKVDLAEEKDLTASKLFPHLEELNIANDIAFYKERKKQDVVMRTVESEGKIFSSIRNEQQSTLNLPVTSSSLAGNVDVNTVEVTTSTTLRTKADVRKSEALDIPVKTETAPLIAEVKSTPLREKSTVQYEEQKTDLAEINARPSTENVKVATPDVKTTTVNRINPELTRSTSAEIPVKTESQSVTAQVKAEQERQRTKINTEEQRIAQPVAQKQTIPTATVKTNTVNATTSKATTTKPDLKKSDGASIPVKTEITSSKKPEAEPVIAKATVPQKSLEELTAPAKEINGRKSEFAQTVNFKSDSLVLALYDNGEIDGDTVSVFMNGVPILARQGLKASAIKKTIYLKPGAEDEFTLVLFAENLGKYPPNTGLLVVRDGEDIYNVRFSADYQKNAGVVFRRQK